MTQLTSILLLISCSVFAHEKPLADSLIANIGKKAKVIFYAEKKADLDEIAKYDLNKLFAEVRKRSEKNFSNNEEVTLREVDENLKNREANTTVSSKKWLKNMNLNLFVGKVDASGGESFLGTRQDFTSTKYGQLSRNEFLLLRGKSSVMFGVGLFSDRQLYRKKRIDVSLKYGFGFELMTARMVTTISYFDISSSVPIPKNDYRLIVDSLKSNSNFRDSDVIYFSPNLFTHVIPTFSVLNRNGKKIFNIGIGLKAAINTAGLSMSKFRRGLFGNNEDYIYSKFKTLQTAWVINIGYKYINLFVQLQPDTGRTAYFNKNNYGLITSTSAGTFSTYTIGLRFGK